MLLQMSLKPIESYWYGTKARRQRRKVLQRGARIPTRIDKGQPMAATDRPRAAGDGYQIRPSALIENLEVSVAHPRLQAVSPKVSAHSKAEVPLFILRLLRPMPKSVVASRTGRRFNLTYAPAGVRVNPGCRVHYMYDALVAVNGERAVA